MLYRIAQLADIPAIQAVRHAVKENRLSDPTLVTDADVAEYITVRGQGWVAETDDRRIVGFAIADVAGKNIWALFVDPNFEAQGIGKTLHRLMLAWYFAQTQETVWLSTDHQARAAVFYTKNGWIATGMVNAIEMKFEMTYGQWLQHTAP
jgi:GNAT superfamily N-acetyltransferase